MKTPPPSPRRRPLGRVVWIAGALLLVAGGSFVVMRVLDAAAAAEARQRLLDEVRTATKANPVDSDGLQRLMVSLKRLPDHETARDLLAAKARIQMARGQAEAAMDTFGALATQPGAKADEQSLGARMLVRVHENGVAEGEAAIALCRQALQLAEAAAAETNDADDLLCAWQAAERVGEHDRSRRFAEQLAAQHAGTPAQRFVAYAMAFDASKGTASLDDVLVDLAPAPVEAEAMRVLLLLHASDLPGAVRVAEAAVARAGGVGVVRWAAAQAFHLAVVSAQGAAEREGWVRRREEQLAWLQRQPGLDAGKREMIAKMREQR